MTATPFELASETRSGCDRAARALIALAAASVLATATAVTAPLAAFAADTEVGDWESLKVAAAAGGTITLTADITAAAGERLDIGAATTIDLAGRRLEIATPSSGAAVRVSSAYALTIRGGGELIANGGLSSAGIGGDDGEPAGTIVIDGGNVTATGGIGGAGIGGGADGSGGEFSQLGGGVTARGGRGGAGIGGGVGGAGGSVTIFGGMTVARGSSDGAGIGGGLYGGGAVFSQFGGDVAAYGGADSAGIGGGMGGEGGIVTVVSGTFRAEGGRDGAGIGSGRDGRGVGTPAAQAGTVTFRGGDIVVVGGISAAAVGGGGSSTNGFGQPGGDVVVSGGRVRLTGGSGAAAIGTGSGGSPAATGTLRVDGVAAEGSETTGAAGLLSAAPSISSVPTPDGRGFRAVGGQTAQGGGTLSIDFGYFLSFVELPAMTAMPSRFVADGEAVPALPSQAPLAGYTPIGWFTDVAAGARVPTVLSESLTLYGNHARTSLGASSVTAGESIDVAVETFDEHGEQVIAVPTAMSASPASAVISGSTVSPVRAGQVTVQAGYLGVALADVRADVTPGPLAWIISLDIHDPTIREGKTVVLTARGGDAYGNDVGEVSHLVTFATGDPVDVVTGNKVLIGFDPATLGAPITRTFTASFGASSLRFMPLTGPSAVAGIRVTAPSTVVRGGEIELRVVAVDAFGTVLGEVDGYVAVTSDVSSDVVSGNRVSFPHASPHTLTVSYGAYSEQLLVEVREPLVDGGPAGLVGTGAEGVVAVVLGLGLLLGGVVLRTRRRSSPGA